MRLPCVLAGIAVFGLTAFAPAPFARTAHRSEANGLAALQGTYQVVGYGRPGKRGGLVRRPDLKVRISGNKWEFLFDSGKAWVTEPSNTDEMKLGPKNSPRSLDLNNGDGVTMKGIVKVEGGKVTFVYALHYSGPRFARLGITPERPTSFDTLRNDAMLLSMEREAR